MKESRNHHSDYDFGEISCTGSQKIHKSVKMTLKKRLRQWVRDSGSDSSGYHRCDWNYVLWTRNSIDMIVRTLEHP